MDQKVVEAIARSLGETSQPLADTARILAENAVPVGVPASVPKAGTAAPAAAPFSLPPAGLPVARVLSDSAAPVARSAPAVAKAVPVFAPAVR
jgi:hypothetical protein